MTWQTFTTERFGLGESPFWHPHEQMLYWLDIAAHAVLRANVFMGTVQRWVLPQTPGCMAPAASGGLVVALRDGVYRTRDWAGALEKIAPAVHDPATARFNDGKADPLGRFWAGTVYEPRDRQAAALFSLDCRQGPAVLRQQADLATVANGLAWSPDACTLYWADTTAHVVRAWDWNSANNTLSGQRVLRQFAAKPPGWLAGQPGYQGRPDGAAVDSQGNYWCALYEGGRLLKLSPTGQVLADIAVPAQCPTMPCFGGDDLQTLYLTTASEKRPDAELQALPLSGCVLSMRVDVPGLPVNFFLD
jgi:sugar lactone lactonase YvrE